MYNKYLKPIGKSQSGYASFVITLISILIISLIVVAFATDSRLEQKNSLADNEATQAYYAAESGINDAYAVVSTYIQHSPPLNPPSTIAPTTNCAVLGSPYIDSTGGSSNQIGGNGFNYTCLIVNPSPPTVTKQDLTPGKGWVAPINTSNDSGANTIKYVTISWVENSATNLSFGGCPSSTPIGARLPTSTNYPSNSCTAGVLQVDILSQNGLNADIGANNGFASPTTTVFLEPVLSLVGGGSDNVPGANATNDQVYFVQCGNQTPSADGQYACTQTIKVAGDTQYYLHLQSFYLSNSVSISVQNSAPTLGGTSNLGISGDEVLLDSTGYAETHYKRIEETVCDNVYCTSTSPDAAIESTQCIDKNFGVFPGPGSNNKPAGTPASPNC